MSTPSFRELTGTDAENYQRYFVPAIATPVSAGLMSAADLQPGERVLDVACGTGIIARLAAERVGRTGSVTATDLSSEMIDVAAKTPASPEPPPPDTGYGAYTPRLLRVYDTVVLGISNRLLWKCPASILQAHYDDFVAPVHLDVGPGTGFFLDHCTFPVERPELTLVDANHHVLEHASRRLARYRPTTLQADIRQPVPLPGGRYGSVALSYVLHCLPGTMAGKRIVFEHLRPLLQPDGVLFGSTILGRSPAHTRRSAAVQRLYNQRGIFGNADDDLEGLQAALASSFARFQVDTRGTVALFAGWVS